MWIRTWIGLFLGLPLSLSLTMNAVLLVPWSRPIGLLFGYLGGFFVLTGYQTWVYCAPDLSALLRWSLPVLVVTAGLNAWALAGSLP
jgi:hypothetical protein